MSGGNQVGQVSGQATSDALNLTNLSDLAMMNRYMQLGLGGVGATPTGKAEGRVHGVPGSGTTPTDPGAFSTGEEILPMVPGGNVGAGAAGTPVGAASQTQFPTFPGSVPSTGTGGNPFLPPSTTASTTPPSSATPTAPVANPAAPAAPLAPGGAPGAIPTAGLPLFTGSGGGQVVPTGGPTAFEMDIGAQPSWTGGVPNLFQGALGEAQFQDIGQTTQAAVGSQQAKTSLLSGVGQLAGGI